MIQRKQTLFLLGAFIMMLLCLTMQVGVIEVEGHQVARVFNLWLTNDKGQRVLESWPLFALMLPAAVIALVDIFLFKQRKLQAQLCILAMLLCVAWYVVLAVLPQSWGGQISMDLPAAFPMVAVILLFLARKGILADDKLVRSLDRIR